MARKMMSECGVARCHVRSRVDAGSRRKMRIDILALRLVVLLIAIAGLPGTLAAQGGSGNSSVQSSEQPSQSPGQGSASSPATVPSTDMSSSASSTATAPAQQPDSANSTTKPAENPGGAQASPADTQGAPNPAAQSAEHAGQPGASQSQEQGTVMPPAMASKSKVPAESNYDEVHVKPIVKSADEAKFNPNSKAKAESEMDPTLRTHTKPIRVDVDLVLVSVTITDPMNRLVTGLEKENFVLLDNGEKQAIQHFSSEDAPISLGVIFDMSGSMSNKIEKSREAVVQFFKTANPEDEFFLIAFNDKPTLISDFTSNVEQVQGQLLYTVPKGRTALLDAIYLGMAKMRQAKHQRKALLIISDGGDNRSRYTENEIKSMVKEADVQIYAIGIFDSSPRSDEERFGPQLLAQVTDVTGGRTFTIDNPNELSDVATKIGVELRNQYVLGYRPTKAAHDGKWRKVRVKLNTPKGLPQLSVYAKTGYYAPTE
jgi:Ca-activated chloride channel homolog